jgi:hypothetical protein
MVAQVQSDSIYPVIPYIYKVGFLLFKTSFGATTVLTVGSGRCRDSNNLVDMVLDSSVSLNGGINGVNGLDAGSMAANTMYGVYAIADSRNNHPTGALLSTSINSNPVMPVGYDSLRLVGYWATGADGSFLEGYYGIGSTNVLDFTYRNPQPTSITAGAATTYTEIQLSSLVPSTDETIGKTQFILNANLAGDSIFLSFSPTSANNFQAAAPVPGSTSLYYGNFNFPTNFFSASSTFIYYKVSSALDSVAINVTGFIVPV